MIMPVDVTNTAQLQVLVNQLILAINTIEAKLRDIEASLKSLGKDGIITSTNLSTGGI